MATDLDMVNASLALVGMDKLASLDNTTNNKVIEVANGFLPRVKRAVLRAHDWNCARRRRELNATTNDSLGEWTYAFRLPDDCLAVRRFVSPYEATAYATYSVELDSQDKRILYTDCGVAKVVYTAEFTDVNRWDALLFDAAVTRLAIEFAAVFPRDSKWVQMNWELYQKKIDEAAGVNETEGGLERVYSDSIASVR